MTRADLDTLLSRLVANANEAMSGDGLLTIATRRVARPEPDGGTTPWIALSIRDTGEGMDAHVRRHCFEPYFTTKSDGPGRGLGLACVHGIVFHTHGRIDVRSTPGVGSCFDILLPEAEAPEPPAAADQADARAPGALAGRRVLLVEDEVEVRRLLEQVLQFEGAEVESVGDGDAALARLEGGDAPDLMISDLRMPGASVQTLVGALHARHPEARVLVLSGFAKGMEEVERALEGVQATFLQKPFRPSGLLTLVQELLAN